MSELERAREILDTLLSDPSVPKNIKELCRNAVARLDNQQERTHIRIGAVIGMIDKISQNTNLPFHNRTQVWEAASLLETAASKINHKK